MDYKSVNRLHTSLTYISMPVNSPNNKELGMKSTSKPKSWKTEEEHIENRKLTMSLYPNTFFYNDFDLKPNVKLGCDLLSF